jgi:hypothetical protein
MMLWKVAVDRQSRDTVSPATFQQIRRPGQKLAGRVRTINLFLMIILTPSLSTSSVNEELFNIILTCSTIINVKCLFTGMRRLARPGLKQVAKKLQMVMDYELFFV